jgi:hypothetical protein
LSPALWAMDDSEEANSQRLSSARQPPAELPSEFAEH